MLLANVAGELFINLVIAISLLVFLVVKIVRVVDDDGEIKKTAKEGAEGVYERLLRMFK
jgi:hypothetical protein